VGTFKINFQTILKLSFGLLNMNFLTTPIEGLIIIEPGIFKDDRGHFFESFNQAEFEKKGIRDNFVQDNQSLSHKGVLRGLHFQNAPFEQGKLVRVASGSVLDIAVDIRRSSPTFGKYFAIELNSTTNLMLWIPPGFAHGFMTLENNTLFLYKCTNFYNRTAESGIRFDDPDLNIQWGERNPVLSEKDLKLQSFKEFINLS
jgi:dTDP-4-dehydrorhamnose 3,5-epimerase